MRRLIELVEGVGAIGGAYAPYASAASSPQPQNRPVPPIAHDYPNISDRHGRQINIHDRLLINAGKVVQVLDMRMQRSVTGEVIPVVFTRVVGGPATGELVSLNSSEAGASTKVNIDV